MYPYLYTIIGLSLFLILFPILLITIFKKRWFHIDNENGTLSKREVRNKMGKREHIFLTLVSLPILIINATLLIYCFCAFQYTITMDKPLIVAASIIILLFVFAVLASAIIDVYYEARKKIFGRNIKAVDGGHLAHGRHTARERWKRMKWVLNESGKNAAMTLYTSIILFNSFILIPILILY